MKDASEDLDALAAEARRQIDEKNYAASLEAEVITDIMKLGYAFFSEERHLPVVAPHGLGSSTNCLGRCVASCTTRDAKEIAKLRAKLP